MQPKLTRRQLIERAAASGAALTRGGSLSAAGARAALSRGARAAGLL